jgi:hypothetical protein
VTGAGGVVLVTGSVLGVLTLNQASNAENDPTLCPNKQCTPEGRRTIDSAATKALFSDIGIGVGAVAVAVGVVLVATGSSEKTEVRTRLAAAEIVPLLGSREAGVAVMGRF